MTPPRWWTSLRARARPVRPLPPVEVRAGRSVPGWLLRATFGAVVLVLLLAAAARTAVAPELAVPFALLVGGWAVARPGPAPAHVALVAGALLLLGSTSAPFDPAALWLAPLAYSATRLGWWAGHAPARGRVTLAALATTGTRDITLVAVATVVGLGSWALAGRPVEALVALGVASLAVLAWALVRRPPA